jgi:hypothetical protein
MWEIYANYFFTLQNKMSMNYAMNIVHELIQEVLSFIAPPSLY